MPQAHRYAVLCLFYTLCVCVCVWVMPHPQPNVIQRYQIFQTLENAKHLQDSDSSDKKLDLQAYVVSCPCLLSSWKLIDSCSCC